MRNLALEAWRRTRAERTRRRERAMLDRLATVPARLRDECAKLTPAALAAHFRTRSSPKSLPGCTASSDTAELQRHLLPFETAQLVERATRILNDRSWALLGFGEKCFGEEIDWLKDPLSGFRWPLDYHADVQLVRNDGSDARVLWELNRLSHLLTLARTYAVTQDEKFVTEILVQLDGWRASNPLGRGPNWSCAMEVALRAINLLATFELIRGSARLDENTLPPLLQMFDQHGAHILRNLEFSYISTSNHYLSDVTGLFWLGVLLPELKEADGWREFGLREMLNEMDKQVLADGADCEASTGYHRLVLELFLYSFILARENQSDIPQRYWDKLRAMFDYMSAYLRPDLSAPLIGDTDSGQVLPFCKRSAEDHAYLLSIAAAFFAEPRYKLSGTPTEELLWVLGTEGITAFEKLSCAPSGEDSRAFADAGTYVQRKDDLFLLLNASGNGLFGRGSHGHNDSLSIEVSACGTSFISDPGTFVYSADLSQRHLFRSTAYHSTVQVDDEEQNTTEASLPFVIGDEAHPKVLLWETTTEHDLVVAEHRGYARLARPVIHTRAVRFLKADRSWLVEDRMSGEGEHVFRFRFHFSDSLATGVRAPGIALARDTTSGARLVVAALNVDELPELEQNYRSRDYGAKSASVSACWKIQATVPLIVRWALVPVCPDDDEEERLSLLARYRSEAPTLRASDIAWRKA